MTGLTETKQFSITAFTLVKIPTNTRKHLAFVFNLNVCNLHSLPGQLTLQYIVSEHAHFLQNKQEWQTQLLAMCKEFKKPKCIH